MIGRTLPSEEAHEAETDRLLRRLDESGCTLPVYRSKLKALIEPQAIEAEQLRADAEQKVNGTACHTSRRPWWKRLLAVVTVGLISGH